MDLVMEYCGPGGGLFDPYVDPNAPEDGDLAGAYQYDLAVGRGRLMRAVAARLGMGSFQVRVRTAVDPLFDPATATLDEWCLRCYAVAEAYRNGGWDMENSAFAENELAAVRTLLEEYAGGAS